MAAFAKSRESRSLAGSSSSPSLYFCRSECPICPMSINLTPYPIRRIAHDPAHAFLATPTYALREHVIGF
jgi:hypothetical protein